MSTDAKTSADGKVEREVEREQRQRILNDEARMGLAPLDELRIKDARENSDSAALRRAPHGDHR